MKYVIQSISFSFDREHVTALNSLRPISLTPFLSKVLEKLCIAQLQRFFTSANAVPVFQSGFRRGHSTTTSLLHLSDTVLRSFDSRCLTAIISLDFSKAFDTIDHDLLVAKLRHTGLSSNVLSFLESYLSSRSQQVMLNQYMPTVSSTREVKRGVPQGSVLGPLLFSIYVNDLPSVCHNCRVYMYADDTQLVKDFVIGRAESAKCEMASDLLRLTAWADAHGLQLNPAKSSLVVVGSPALRQQLSSFVISWGSASLSMQPTVKILGVTFDSSWCFEQYVAVLCRSAFARLRFLYPSRRILSTHIKLSLCQSLVISLLDYADVVYGPCLTTRLSAIVQRIQNSCLRYSYNIRKFDHISPLFLRSGWLKVRQRWILHLCCIVHKVLHSETPIYLNELLCSNSSMHSVHAPSTRRGADLSVPAHRTVKFTASFSYLSSLYYNSLPLDIRSLTPMSAFKCAARSFILVHYP